MEPFRMPIDGNGALILPIKIKTFEAHDKVEQVYCLHIWFTFFCLCDPSINVFDTSKRLQLRRLTMVLNSISNDFCVLFKVMQ